LPDRRRPPFRLLAVSQLAGVSRADAATWFAALAAAGVDALQLREKGLADRDLFELALAARAALALPALAAAGGRGDGARPALPAAAGSSDGAGPPLLLVNGRADIAIAAGADGVHLPGDGLPVGAMRGRFGADWLIGVSTHSVEEVEAAARAGADYAVFGPVYATPGKPGARPTGAAGLAAAAQAGIPVYALGGVTLERFAEVAAAGAAGVAAIRLFQPVAGLEGVVQAAREHFP
jgi:thiamine monophosphate synthase